MTLTIDQAVPRFQTNETRFDTFVNGGASATWVTSGGSVQPSITKFLADRASYVDALAATTLSASTAAKNAAEAARDEAVEAAETATSAAALFDPDNYQPKDDTLTSLAALGTAPGKIAYTTGVDTWAEAEITAAGRALLDDTDAAAQRATLGLGTAATAGFLDENDFASDSATAAPSQQSTKAYVNALAEGAPDAPRVRIGALQRLNPGNQIRWSQDAEQRAGSEGGTSQLNFAFMQVGTVRVSFEHRFYSASSPGRVSLYRRRGGVATGLATYSNTGAYVERTVDCPVLPGDLLYLLLFDLTYVRKLRIKTAGEDLFPGVEANLVGNTYNA